jgi:hypothetical protein
MLYARFLDSGLRFAPWESVPAGNMENRSGRRGITMKFERTRFDFHGSDGVLPNLMTCAILVPSFPRNLSPSARIGERESSVVQRKPLGPRFRGDDERQR